MDWITSETGIRFAGLMCFVLAAYTIWMGQMTVKGLPGGYRNPVLALELVENGKDIDRIKIAEEGKAIPFLSKQIQKDFGYIVLYVIVFSWLALLLSFGQTPSRPWLGWLTAFGVIVAGVLDVLENRGMLAALNASTATDSMANSIRYPSLGKWALLFIFSLVLGFLLLQHQGALRVTTVLFLVAALSGLAGVITNLIRPWFYVMFPIAIISLGLGLLCIAIIFTFWPSKVFTP